MSLFTDASLVMVPSGYKTSKVYSVKPTDGSGDLTFTRSNDTATRVGPDGLIQRVRTNLILQSNTFTTSWSYVNATLTGGQSGYDGTTNGWKLEATATSCYIAQSSYSVLRNHSIYAKAGTFNLVSIIVGGYGQGVTFNLTTGAVVTNTNSALYSPVITSVGSGWYRISVGIQAAAPTYGMLIAPNDIYGGTISTGEFIYIQSAQTEYNDIATDYIATTTAAVSVGPVSGLPRLDYLNSSCPRLLLEPQRTNLVTYSENFDNAAWTTTNATITANSAVSPDGYTNADKITDTANNTQHRVTQSISVTSGTSYTASIFVKNDDKGDFAINFTNTGFSTTKIVFNLINGTVTSGTGTIQDYGNGWYRISATAAANATGSGTIGFNLGDGGSYVGSSQSVFIYAAQIEAGAYATSYIPTLGAAVTRGVDAASKTGISSLIGQTEGTLFIEANFTSGYDLNNVLMNLSDGVGSSNLIYINRSIGKLEFFVQNASLTQMLYLTPTILSAGVHKMALGYKANDFVVYIDGVLAHTDTSGSVPACSKLNLGSYWNASNPYNNGVSQALLFKTRLTNAQLAELTA